MVQGTLRQRWISAHTAYTAYTAYTAHTAHTAHAHATNTSIWELQRLRLQLRFQLQLPPLQHEAWLWLIHAMSRPMQHRS